MMRGEIEGEESCAALPALRMAAWWLHMGVAVCMAVWVREFPWWES